MKILEKYQVTKYKITTVEMAFECNALWEVSNGSVLCKNYHAKMESSKYRESKITSQNDGTFL